ncbi:MAG: UDP-forming cellulose synthase catalytic subunit [Terracidiphilus sp.]|nr:UDP-forming cellulose synthase catalytic subunit [Terracidiphilus sp.]
MASNPERPGVIVVLFRAVLFIVAAFLAFQLISIYLSWRQQLVLGAVTVLTGIVVNRTSASRLVTITMMLISMLATLRYGWWRVHLLIDYFTDESINRLSLDTVFLLLLISAEAYTVVIMLLGYMQTAWPLQRAPIAMPPDVSKWPDVDVLIPTYNEPLSLVCYTALAALNIDYPPEKLHVYILDDGTREDYLEFSRQAGVGYITRTEHEHAKAGNINHALTTVHSPYVAIFDCDHLPTRSFLQMTMGWMLADQKLAMLQTPHHFYSPDPFERNLLQYKTIPNEGELFYGIVQDGNDFWNSTFFCGSCALLRRSALDEVGGIAVETVTEDAHTSLRMQKKGYNTAYINMPQAAGLATETLSAHVGQRVRWARGMIQILRTENPLFARGLKLYQRLCYFNAMAHFLYAVPRLIFLGAPLVYLLLGRTIIPGYWLAILVYAMPHLILASMTNSRVQGRHRHSFWNEIYETVLAPYILVPTFLAMVNPKLGKFNVTGKGSTLSKNQFDSKIAAPTTWILFLNFVGLIAVPYRLSTTTPDHHGAIFMNMAWVLFNMMILGVAAAVAFEQKQRRSSVRIEVQIPVRVDLPDGRKIVGTSVDMSVGGSSVSLSEQVSLAVGDKFKMAFPEQTGEAEIDAKVVGIHGKEYRIQFSLPTISAQETLTRALYSRADAWISPLALKEVDRPLVSLWRVFRLSLYGIRQVLGNLLPERGASSASKAAGLVLVVALGGWATANASAQSVQRAALPRVTSAAQKSAHTTTVRGTAVSGAQDAVSTALQTLTMKDMGVRDGIEMRGSHSYYSTRFTLSHAQVPRQATFRLVYTTDPKMELRTSSLRVILNGFTISNFSPSADQVPAQGISTVDITIPGDVLVRNNLLTFEFTGSGVLQSEEKAKTQVYLRISNISTLEVRGDRLPWGNDLSQLPLPVFDGELQATTTVPLVFFAQPTPKTLEAAGIVASWLGLHSSAKPVHFVVSYGQIPVGNAIVLANRAGQLLAAMQIPEGRPLIALRSNPGDAAGSVLVLAGQDDDQLLNAARSLALMGQSAGANTSSAAGLAGDTAFVSDVALPQMRARDDAPRWLAATRTSPIVSCQTQDAYVSDGSTPVILYLHVPPDLYYGEVQTVTMHLHYRYNAAPIAVGSALRVLVNGMLVNEIPLLPGSGYADGQRAILVPVASLRPFGNTVQFNYDFIRDKRKQAEGSEAGALEGRVLCNSSLDLHGLPLWATMPNLELFANAGFPFTRMADLSETTVVLPSSPSREEAALYLNLMAHFGAQTGYPALRVTVAGPETVINKGRDYLILGTVENQPAFSALAPSLPVSFDASGLHVRQEQSSLGNGFLGFSGLSGSPAISTLQRKWQEIVGTPEARELPANPSGMPEALIEEIESPSSPDRSIVLIELRQNSSAEVFTNEFLDRSQSGDIAGSASVLANGNFQSYAMGGAAYHVGNVTWYAILRIWLTQHFLLLLLTVTVFMFVVAGWIYGWMSWHARKRLTVAGTEDKERIGAEDKE